MKFGCRTLLVPCIYWYNHLEIWFHPLSSASMDLEFLESLAHSYSITSLLNYILHNRKFKLTILTKCQQMSWSNQINHFTSRADIRYRYHALKQPWSFSLIRFFLTGLTFFLYFQTLRTKLIQIKSFCNNYSDWQNN